MLEKMKKTEGKAIIRQAHEETRKQLKDKKVEQKQKRKIQRAQAKHDKKLLKCKSLGQAIP